MTTTPLPPLPAATYVLTIAADSGYESTMEGRCDADQYALAVKALHEPAQARADLEAKVARLRDFVRKYVKWVEEENHPTEGTTFWDRIEMCRELDALAREALKETP